MRSSLGRLAIVLKITRGGGLTSRAISGGKPLEKAVQRISIYSRRDQVSEKSHDVNFFWVRTHTSFSPKGLRVLPASNTGSSAKHLEGSECLKPQITGDGGCEHTSVHMPTGRAQEYNVLTVHYTPQAGLEIDAIDRTYVLGGAPAHGLTPFLAQTTAP